MSKNANRQLIFNDCFLRMAKVESVAENAEIMLSELASVYAEHVGYRLCTLSVFEDSSEVTSRRIWSSHPKEYPVSGKKSKPEQEWLAKIVDQNQPFLCRDKADVKRVLFDYELIYSLGCGSALNLPVRLMGSVIGTVNLLHEEHWYTPERVEIAEQLLTLAYVPMIMACWPGEFTGGIKQ